MTHITEIFFWGQEPWALKAAREGLPSSWSLRELPPGAEGLKAYSQESDALLICPPLTPQQRELLHARRPSGRTLILELNQDSSGSPMDACQEGLVHLLIPPAGLAAQLALVGCLAPWCGSQPSVFELGEAAAEQVYSLGQLIRVAGSFRVANGVEEIFQQLTQALVNHFPYRRAILFTREGDRLRPRSLAWPGGDPQALRAALEDSPPVLGPNSPELAGISLGRATPLDLERGAMFSPAVTRLLAPAREVALAPLFTDREFIGLVEADFAELGDRPLMESDLALLEALATLAGTMIYNSNLYAELESKTTDLALKVRELTMLAGISRIFNRGDGPVQTAQDLVAVVSESLEAPRGFILVHDEQSQNLRLWGHQGLDQATTERWHSLGPSQVERLAHLAPEQKAALARGQLEASQFLPGLEGPTLLNPLRSRGQFIGMWGLNRNPGSEPFNRRLRQLLTAGDEHAVVVINSLRLRHLAATDALTGLYGRRYFDHNLELKVRAARRLGAPLSLIILDVDHFKNVNDTHGHQGGDAVLTALGRTLKKLVPPGEVICRIGGEEFALILSRHDMLTAHALAERIRARMEQLVVEYKGAAIRVTVSLGVARQEAGQSMEAEELFRRADQALYQAKRQGRNQVMGFTLS